MRYACYDCPGKPCIIDVPESQPDVCPFSGEEGEAHTCNWGLMKDRRTVKK